MANVTVICPHCDNQFKYKLPTTRKMKTIRVRPGPQGARFEYMATVDANVLEAGQFTRLDDWVLYPVGAALGAALGSMAYAMADNLAHFLTPEPLLYFAGIGGGLTILLTHWWLCDEAVVRSKAMRWFNEMSGKWLLVNEDEHKPVVLEVSHRERDGAGETGRTIQYFGTLPVAPESFTGYVKAILAGETLSIARWTGAGKPFSRQEYERLLDILRQAGAVVNLPGKGNQLTQHGKRAFTNHLRQSAPLPRHLERA